MNKHELTWKLLPNYCLIIFNRNILKFGDVFLIIFLSINLLGMKISKN
ncbi:hypothetical protein Q757_00925 [Oenococcus alcoholitolerans]|uniref:Uncharacterized protein n=1 Tax=Oenococcus alcoholitolerans TaxID=931074 RepID=A0ABR4XSI4_9LACO|nr:hypothetical protein Q757_00925 [Oenococcus alcoholitolerans]